VKLVLKTREGEVMTERVRGVALTGDEQREKGKIQQDQPTSRRRTYSRGGRKERRDLRRERGSDSLKP